jgi:hypothetical protein
VHAWPQAIAVKRIYAEFMCLALVGIENLRSLSEYLALAISPSSFDKFLCVSVFKVFEGPRLFRPVFCCAQCLARRVLNGQAMPR